MLVQTTPLLLVDGLPAASSYHHDMDDYTGSKDSKPFLYNFNSQSLTHSVSLSSLEVGVVPDYNAMADISNTTLSHRNSGETVAVSGIDREARVLKYREK